MAIALAWGEISDLVSESVAKKGGRRVNAWVGEHCSEGNPAEKNQGDGLTGRGFTLFCEPR
jgi:hypothetical protein